MTNTAEISIEKQEVDVRVIVEPLEMMKACIPAGDDPILAQIIECYEAEAAFVAADDRCVAANNRCDDADPALRDELDRAEAHKDELTAQISTTSARSLDGVLAKLRMVGDFSEWEFDAGNPESQLVAPPIGNSIIADLERIIGEMRAASPEHDAA